MMSGHTPVPPITSWLREQKRLRRVSLRHIARFAHLSTNTVKNVLDGVVERPTPETIAKLAAYFKVPPDDLMALAGYVRPRTFEEWISTQLAGLSFEEKRAMLEERRRSISAILGREGILDHATLDWVVTAILKEHLREEWARKEQPPA